MLFFSFFSLLLIIKIKDRRIRVKEPCLTANPTKEESAAKLSVCETGIVFLEAAKGDNDE